MRMIFGSSDWRASVAIKKRSGVADDTQLER
jgi:hypothetical protein